MCSVAASLVAVPELLVKTALNFHPSMDLPTPLSLSVVLVWPTRFLYVAPPSVDSCHWTVGAGFPEALEVKIASWLSCAKTSAGCCVTSGFEFTVSVAALLVALPALFVNTARNR